MAGGLWRQFEKVAAARAEAPALLQGDATVTFQALHQAAASAAVELAAEGLRPGQRCLFWATNSGALAAFVLGAWRIGAIVTLVNDEAPLRHLEHAAAVTDATLIVTDPGLAAKAGTIGRRMKILSAPRAEPQPISLAAIHEGEPASIFFTSGSTSLPKGVTQSHANLMAGCRMVANHLGLRSDDRILCPIPWSFDYGYGQLLSTLLRGITQVLPVARNPFALCQAIDQHRPTVFAGLPSIFSLLLRGISPIRSTDLGSIRLLTNTGAAIPRAIYAELLALFGHCDISLNYGMTETYRSAGLPVALARQRPESVGFAYPGVSIAVMRDNGEEADPGEVGEIVHRGMGAFLGYWGAPDATRQVLRPDPLWNHAGVAAPLAVFTGDLGWKDGGGFLTVKGRRDRLIKSMGVRVSPDEVETVLRESGLVSDIVVMGMPHDIIGEMVTALITTTAKTPDPVPALKAFARRALSPHMQPREYRVLETLPLTPSGKMDFAAMRALMMETREQGGGRMA